MSSEMPSKRAKELWNSGIPLSRAWLEFAPPELRSEFENLPEFKHSFDAISEAESWQIAGSIFATALKNTPKRVQLERQLKERLLTDLFNGNLAATGYRTAPSRSQVPVLIDPEKFENDDPVWSGDGLAAQGITYCRIRVTDPDNCNPAPAKDKGSREAIDAAIDHLKSLNSSFCELDRKVACQEIREFLGVKQIAGNGLSNQNLAKAIVRKCGPKRISK